MYKNLSYIFIVLLLFAVNATAVINQPWTNGNSNQNWLDPLNWQFGEVPNGNFEWDNSVALLQPEYSSAGAYPIVSGAGAVCDVLYIGGGSRAAGFNSYNFKVASGGTLTVSRDIFVRPMLADANNPGGYTATVYIDPGSTLTANGFLVANLDPNAGVTPDDGNNVVEMTGGTLNASIWYGVTTKQSQINLQGGTINSPAMWFCSGGTMNMTGGIVNAGEIAVGRRSDNSGDPNHFNTTATNYSNFDLSAGAVTLIDTGVWPYFGNMIVGWEGGKGRVNLSGGTLNAPHLLYLGVGTTVGDYGEMNISNSSVLNSAQVFVNKGQINLSSGTINNAYDMDFQSGSKMEMTGGSVTTGELQVGTVASPDYGVFEMSSGTVTVKATGGYLKDGNVVVGWRGGKGRINMTGGTLNMEGHVWLGVAAGDYAEVNMFDGVLNIKGSVEADGANPWYHVEIQKGTVNWYNTDPNGPAYVRGLANEGKWTGYGDGANIRATYDPATHITTITAVSTPWGDLNDDHAVDLLDFSILAQHWLATDCRKCILDAYDNTGTVDIWDLDILAGNWLVGK